MKKFGAFVVGGIVGAGVALLAAPRPGDETRAIVTDWANNALGDQGNLTERVQIRRDQITHDAGVIAEQASTIAQAGFAKAKEGFGSVGSQVPPVFNKQESESDAELRARIEQARARIANQVAENAARAGEAVPAVQDAAKDVAARVKETANTAAEAVKSAASKEAAPEAEAPAEDAPKAE